MFRREEIIAARFAPEDDKARLLRKIAEEVVAR